MQFAVVNGTRALPAPRATGTCALCLAPMIAKCGAIKVWHWAHASREHCDPWWERESDWHRSWKQTFPPHWREAICHDESTGERHIADVRTPTGTVLELQHASISTTERRSRESFYRKLVWLVDGRSFRARFQIHSPPLPPPGSEMATHLAFNRDGSEFWPRSSALSGYSTRYLREKYDWEVGRQYCGHHFFHWKNERPTWLLASNPVVFDFGNDELASLQTFQTDGRLCVQQIGRAHV